MMKTSKYNRNKTSKAVGLYIHIPFCDKKCNYCDFLSFATTEGSSYREYVSTLIKEIHYYGKVYNNEYYVDTVFIGGGTPSLIPEAFVKEIMAAVSAAFHIAKDAEISIEANPGTLTKNKLNTYLRAGINRLSMGVQSLDNTLLKTLGRIHTAEEAIENYLMARDCGFDNINLDLMFALPGQTQEIWHNTLENALNLSPSHISFYSLQYEEGTPFFEGLKKGILEETSDGLYIEMYKTALAMLKSKGYSHYEISNAAQPGYFCKHNLKYWSLDNYLGFGLGAHSYLDGQRFSNIEELEIYISALGVRAESEIESALGLNPELAGPAVIWHHTNTKQDNISEYIITGLRKINGIKLQDFEERFGQSILNLYSKEVKDYLDQEFLEVVDGQLRFTLKGIFISNSILADFV